MTTKIHIKHMVSLRCKLMVKAALDEIGLHYDSVELGLVVVKGKISAEKFNNLKSVLLKCGLELVDDKKSIMIEKIKILVVEMVHYEEEFPRINFSEYIAKKLNYDYGYISSLFSEVTGGTIENYIIAHMKLHFQVKIKHSVYFGTGFKYYFNFSYKLSINFLTDLYFFRINFHC